MRHVAITGCYCLCAGDVGGWCGGADGSRGGGGNESATAVVDIVAVAIEVAADAVVGVAWSGATILLIL